MLRNNDYIFNVVQDLRKNKNRENKVKKTGKQCTHLIFNNKNISLLFRVLEDPDFINKTTN